MNAFLCILLSTFFPSNCIAQTDTGISFRNAEPFINFDKHLSFIASRAAKMDGIRIGLSYLEKYKVGIGYTGLSDNTPLYEQFIQGSDTINARLRFGYFSSSFEYIFYEKDRWQLSVPVHLGLGQSYYAFTDKSGKELHFKQQPVIVYQPSFTGYYKIIKWVGVGFGVGFRVMLLSNPFLNEHLNSLIYILNLKIFPFEIYHSIFPPKVVKS